MLNIDFDFVICVINFGNIILNLLAFVLHSEIDTRHRNMVVSQDCIMYICIYFLIAGKQWNKKC